MKVLHIEAGRFLYGGAQQVAWLTHGLAQRGVQNVLVCPEDGDIQNAVAESTVIHAIPMRGDLDLGLVPRWPKLSALSLLILCTYTAGAAPIFSVVLPRGLQVFPVCCLVVSIIGSLAGLRRKNIAFISGSLLSQRPLAGFW